MEADMPCKKKNPSQLSFQETGAGLGAPNKVPKTKYACVVESHESTSQPMAPTLQKCHENNIAAKSRQNSINHDSLVHIFIPMQKAMRTPDAKAAVDKAWKKLETIQVWRLDKVKSKKDVILEAQRSKSKVHFALLMD